MEARSLLMVGLLVATFSLAGCLDGAGLRPAITVGSQGQFSPGTVEDSTGNCGETARFDAGIQGQGHLTITVWDGEGNQKASLTLNGNQQRAMDKDLTGEPGDWRIKVEAKKWNDASNPGNYGGYDLGFNGQFGASLLC